MPDPVCVACGESNSTIFCSHERIVRRCLSCDLLFVFPQPDAKTLHESFQSDYFEKGHMPGETRLDLEFELWRRPTIANIAGQIRKVKETGNLLDVGCASGELFDCFNNTGWQLYGIEPSKFAFKRAAERFGSHAHVHLFNRYLSEVRFEPNSFDVITLLESLYYMKDPARELSLLMPLLKDDGVLAIAVPGYAYCRLRHSSPISHALNGKKCSLPTSHLFYFSETSMVKLLTNHGFAIVRTAQVGTSVYGNGLRRSTQSTYLACTSAIERLTFGRIKLAPHQLYLCSKAQSA